MTSPRRLGSARKRKNHLHSQSSLEELEEEPLADSNETQLSFQSAASSPKGNIQIRRVCIGRASTAKKKKRRGNPIPKPDFSRSSIDSLQSLQTTSDEDDRRRRQSKQQSSTRKAFLSKRKKVQSSPSTDSSSAEERDDNKRLSSSSSSSDEEEMEVPYTQHFGLAGEKTRTLPSDDEDDNIAKEPLRPGDISK